MFLDTPDGSAFLRGAKGIAPGDIVLVQVTGHAELGKAIPVTAKLLLKSRYAIVTPDAPGINISRSIRDEEQRVAIRAAAETESAETCGFGIILRSACSGANADVIAEDVDAMIGLARAVLDDDGRAPDKLIEGPGPHELAWRDWPATETLPGTIEDWLPAALAAEVTLPSGASMHVEPTRALVAVDINTGGDTSPAAGLKANIAAARALPRALRVRGLGGQIVVDFAPMSKKDRQSLEAALRAAFRGDETETALIGWTAMGHYRIESKARTRSTRRVDAMSCPICKAKPNERFRPFCSQRCADLDLGRWLTGAYAIPSEEPLDEDVETPDQEMESRRQRH